MLRLNPDGSPDEGFGSDGAVLIDFGGLGNYATDLAVQADGKIIVAGYAEIGEADFDIALARLNQDGSIDTTFGISGRATLGVGGSSEYTARMALLPNGKIVVAGATNAGGTYDVLFARFNPDGTLDTSFGTGPVAGTTLVESSGSEDQPYSMILQADGKLMACGHSGPRAYDAAGGQMLAIRVNPDGSVDGGFGTNGVSLIATGAPRGGGRGCVAMPDGKTVLAGFSGTTGNEDLLLARLASDGALDTSFASEGFSIVDLGGSESLQAIVRLADGTLGVTGLTGVLYNEWLPDYPRWAFEAPGNYSETLFARIDSESGMLDPDFGNDGVTLVDFGRAYLPSMAFGRGLIQQADGKLLAVGASVEWGDWWNLHRIALARVDPAGDGNAGIASLVSEYSEVSEGNADVVLSVRRTGGSTGELSVDYNTVPESANSPDDFTATSGTLTWLSGETGLKSIIVPITDDTTSENIETFTVVLSSSSNHVGLANRYVLIDANDAPTPQPPPAPAPAPRGGGGAAGLEVLMTLAVLWALGIYRRRRD